MLVIKKVDSSNVDEFSTMKVELIKYHIEFAEQLGVDDQICKNYDTDQAKKHFNEPNYEQYLLINELGTTVGFSELKYAKSEIDQEPCIVLYNFYVKKEFENNGYGTAYINLLKERYKKIELECFYNLPSHKFYKKMGFKIGYTHYFIN